MKLSKKQKEFIIDAYNSNDVCSGWKTKIKNNFPKLFESKLEIGKWYKYGNNLFCFNGEYDNNDYPCGYGFLGGGTWNDDNSCGWGDKSNLPKGSEEEVEEALIKEAKKRGFKKNGSYRINDALGNKNYYAYAKHSIYFSGDNNLWLECGCVFSNGKWAEIINTLTRKEAEEKLGVTIVD